MGLETNAELIRVLEKQIEEGSGDIIKLKRTRNSLLNISARVPPEILAEIFSWNLIRPDPDPELDSHFYGSCEGSDNFLLVCHHWFQVASQTPTLWSFCGNNVWDWEKWFRRHPQSTPLDLVLYDKTFGTMPPIIHHALQDTLKDRAARDVIRQVHLRCRDRDLLPSAISSLTPEGEGVQWRSIESIDLRHPWKMWGMRGANPLDLSNFFTRVRLPKLRSLLLDGPLVLSSLDHLAQQTTILTTLSLNINTSLQYQPPTASPLFSILVSNPGLQVLSLGSRVIPKDDDGPMSHVTLQNLKRLYLTGEVHSVIRMLERLTFPGPLNSLQVTTVDSVVESVLQTLGPYVRQYFWSDRGLWNRLELGAQVSRDLLAVSVKSQDGAGDSSQFSAGFKVRPARGTPRDVMQNLCHDLVAFIPQEHVCTFDTNLPPDELEDLFIAMPNTEILRFTHLLLTGGFLLPDPDGSHAKTKLLPSLRSLYLGDVVLLEKSWRPLVTYLGHQASDGRTISLEITCTLRTIGVADGPHMCPEVVKEVESLVEGFSCGVDPRGECPLGRCRGGVKKPGE